jgi:hypothetical protein
MLTARGPILFPDEACALIVKVNATDVNDLALTTLGLTSLGMHRGVKTRP